jgi:hypothetical protein
MRRAKLGGKIVAAGTLPLLIYVLVGPSDGNPVGLGLLMCLGWLVGGGLAIIGLIGAVIARFRGDRS